MATPAGLPSSNYFAGLQRLTVLKAAFEPKRHFVALANRGSLIESDKIAGQVDRDPIPRGFFPNIFPNYSGQDNEAAVLVPQTLCVFSAESPLDVSARIFSGGSTIWVSLASFATAGRIARTRRAASR